MTLETALTNLFTHVARDELILPVTPASVAMVAKIIIATLDPHPINQVARRTLAEALGDLSLDNEIRRDGPAAVAKDIAAEVDCLMLLGMGGSA